MSDTLDTYCAHKYNRHACRGDPVVQIIFNNDNQLLPLPNRHHGTETDIHPIAPCVVVDLHISIRIQS